MTSIDKAQHDLLSRMGQLKQLASQPIAPSWTPAAGGVGGFAAAFSHALKAVDGQQHRAAQMTAAVDSGQSDNLMGAMLESQKASVAFSALIQVRNKLTSAFDDVMKTPL